MRCIYVILFIVKINNYLYLSLSLLGEEPAGFRAGYSTFDHMFVLHCSVDIYRYHNKRVFCAFVDYKKAFDLIDRSSFWLELIATGDRGKILNVIYHMYDNAKSCVIKNSDFSAVFDCQIGVRQGENLSPLLFAIFINDFHYHMSQQYSGIPFVPIDMANCINNDELFVLLRLWVLLYADDIIILAKTACDLQKALDALSDYCKQWKIIIVLLLLKTYLYRVVQSDCNSVFQCSPVR